MNFIATCPYILGDDSDTFGKKCGIFVVILLVAVSVSVSGTALQDCTTMTRDQIILELMFCVQVVDPVFAKTFLLSQQRTRCWLMNGSVHSFHGTTS